MDLKENKEDEFGKFVDYLSEKYKFDFQNLGAKRNDSKKHENNILEKLLLKYYSRKENSEYFIDEICFVHRIIQDISLRNRVLCQSFGDLHIWGDFNDDEDIVGEMMKVL